MPKIRIKLARAGYPFTDISGADPEDYKLNRGTPGIHLTPDMAPRELVVTHNHLKNLIRNPHIELEILDKGPAPAKPESLKPKVYEYPWEEELDKKEAEEREREEQKKFADNYRAELDKVRESAKESKGAQAQVIPAQNKPPPKPEIDSPPSSRK
jgi:hypothetical protein